MTERPLETFPVCAAILVALTALRLGGLHVSTVDLHFDESQYWTWAQEPALGYFSKPPLLAWVIAATEFVCGSGEACIRSPAPLFHLATSLLIYATAASFYDRTIAFWSALTFALATGVSFSARVISTDVPLLFFWALALLAYVRLIRGSALGWSLVLGIALGLGLLSKYAMIYFVACAVIAAAFDSRACKLVRSPAFVFALAIGVLIVLPNLLWNFENGLSTFRHTGANIQGSGIAFNPLKAIEFLASQFAVFGPIAFAALIAAAIGIARPPLVAADRLMLAFALPVIALITATAFVTRAHPNWAATAYVAGAIGVASFLLRHDARRWLLASAAIGIAVQAALFVGDWRAYEVNVPGLARGDVYAPTLGWHALGEKAAQLASRVGAPAVVATHRRDVASLIYYLREKPVEVRAWRHEALPADHFELSRPLDRGTKGPLLLIARCAAPAGLTVQFDKVEPLGALETVTGPTSARTFHAFLLAGMRDLRPWRGGC